MLGIITTGLILAVIEIIVVCIILPLGITLLVALVPPVLAVIAAVLLVNYVFGKEEKEGKK